MAEIPGVAWRPRGDAVERAHMTRFRRTVARSSNQELADYASLHAWSVEHPEAFWKAVWEFTGVRAAGQTEPVLLDGGDMREARWFPRARLNFAENLLRFEDEGVALICQDESGLRSTWTYRELSLRVDGVARVLHSWGVGPGDRVAGLLVNGPEAVVAMLATTSLGAVWSSCSPDFGFDGVRDRFGQIRPKVLFACEGYRYGGKVYDVLPTVDSLRQSVDSIEQLVVVSNLGGTFAAAAAAASAEAAASSWRFEDLPTGLPPAPRPRLPFDHPVYILYSSGTTGLPKCIVHGAGGTLLQHLKELVLHNDLRREDRFFYFTTCGWMMWNWLVSGLAVGATLVLYDGSPFHPEPDSLWTMAQDHGISRLGTSAKYLALAEKRGVRPAMTHRLDALRTILSTGSVLAPESFDYVYRDVKRDVHLASISGGTDIVSCFVLGDPTQPVHRGELQVPGLGMAVEIFDEEGRALEKGPGELVCTRPFPAMPVAFWGDEDGELYRKAYFDHYPGVWRHGDWCERGEGGGLIIHGRSDATLNPGGVRIGTGEIYRQVESFDEILEALAIGQRWQGDVRIVLFVRMRPGCALDDALKESIRRRVRENTSVHHVPRRILEVEDLPRTRSGKISELAAGAAVHGEPVENVGALANPAALEYFRDRPELAR